MANLSNLRLNKITDARLDDLWHLMVSTIPEDTLDHGMRQQMREIDLGKLTNDQKFERLFKLYANFILNGNS